jgi:hypothetical protein
LEAISRVTSRGADIEAFREVMSIHAADNESLWKECTKFRWARLRMNLYCWKQRAYASFFNQLSALKEDETQRLEVAYGAGRWKNRKKGLRQLQRQERTKSVHGVSLRYL